MKELFKQAVKFIGISGIGWIIDFCIYTTLGFFSKNLLLNNMISSCAGVTFVFIFATRKVFQNNSKIPLKWKYVIYLLYQFLLIFSVSVLLKYINGAIHEYITVDIILKYSSIISKIIITPVTMVLNFFVMKGLIEKI